MNHYVVVNEGFCEHAEHVWCFLHQLNLCIGDANAGKGIAADQPSASSSSSASSRQFWKDVANQPRGTFVPFRRDRSKAESIVKELCEGDAFEEDVDSQTDCKNIILVLDALPFKGNREPSDSELVETHSINWSDHRPESRIFRE